MWAHSKGGRQQSNTPKPDITVIEAATTTTSTTTTKTCATTISKAAAASSQHLIINGKKRTKSTGKITTNENIRQININKGNIKKLLSNLMICRTTLSGFLEDSLLLFLFVLFVWTHAHNHPLVAKVPYSELLIQPMTLRGKTPVWRAGTRASLPRFPDWCLSMT